LHRKMRPRQRKSTPQYFQLFRKILLGLFPVLFSLAAPSPCHSLGEVPGALKADRVVVEKSARRLTLFTEGREIKSYRIALGSHPKGPKVQEGDGRTPEGWYVIDSRNSKSNYHLALHISYPDDLDILRAQYLGVSPGSNILIHGVGGDLGWLDYVNRDWTEGCISVTNTDIEEIWNLVPDGTPIIIKP
jgi:murein L,D-transpeptidase YafK